MNSNGWSPVPSPKLMVPLQVSRVSGSLKVTGKALVWATKRDVGPVKLVMTGGVFGATVTGATAENSEVLPAGSVAVALTTCPSATATGNVAVKLTSPLPSVVTVVAPRKVCPSPNPDGSATALAKNSMRKTVLGVLLSVPVMVVLPAPVPAEVMTG